MITILGMLTYYSELSVVLLKLAANFTISSIIMKIIYVFYYLDSHLSLKAK